MTKLQLGVVGSAVVLFLVLYFGCETKPPAQIAVEKSRALAAESADIQVLLKKAKEELSTTEANRILSVETALEEAESDSARVESLKQLSGQWYRLGKPEIAGHYAEEIAQIEASETAWSIAGTTYAICVQRQPDDRIRNYCYERAVKAFESAISLNPENPDHRLNLALVYTEIPPQDNPMKGILLLRELNEQYPENVSVLTNLARLALQTGQSAKAVERLSQALEVEPDNVEAVCLMAEAQKQLGNTDDAATFESRCQQLRN